LGVSHLKTVERLKITSGSSAARTGAIESMAANASSTPKPARTKRRFMILVSIPARRM